MTQRRRACGETRWLVQWFGIIARLEPPAQCRRGHPDEYPSLAMMKAFFLMTVKKIKRPQGLWNYLAHNDCLRKACGFPRQLPHVRTFQRRFQRLSDELDAWLRKATEMAIAKRYITARVAAADKSLHPARGPLWHKKHRRRGKVPKKLRNVDRDSEWGFSPYHRFVQGYAEHTIVNATPGEARFPLDAVAGTAAMAENVVLRQRLAQLPAATGKMLLDGFYDDGELLAACRQRRLEPILPPCVFRAKPPRTPIRQWAAALQQKPANRRLYGRRREVIEPHFGLDKKRFENHVVWFKGLPNNRTHLALVSFVIQVLMLDNFAHQRPPEEIQWLLDAAA